MRCLLLSLAVAVGMPAAALSQVFDSGPSDSSLFTTVINLPEDQPMLAFLSGNMPGMTTQVNVAAGGSLGPNVFATLGSEVNFYGGSATFFFTSEGSEVNIIDGEIDDINIDSEGEANISGGLVSDISLASDSVVRISGGSVSEVRAGTGSEISISGGRIVGVSAATGSEVNLFGHSFELDGMLLSGITPGESFVITDRDVTLMGVLSDGSSFEYNLNSGAASGPDFLAAGATLSVTLIPEPTAASLGLLAMAASFCVLRRH